MTIRNTYAAEAWDKVYDTKSKYTKWYFDLVSSRFFKNIVENAYYEKHHIIPRSIGGSNDKSNLVTFSRREHILAHWLLSKICIKKNHKRKMQHAFHIMVFGKNKNPNGNLFITSCLKKAAQYEISAARKGVKHSIDARKKMSSSRKGKPLPMETVLKISASNTGKKRTLQQKNNISSALRGFPSRMSEERLLEWKLNCSRAQIGKKLSAETRLKMSVSRTGRVVSTDTRKKISKAQKGKYVPAEVGQKISDANSFTWEIVSPKNEIFKIQDLQKFCYSNNIPYSSLIKTFVSGKKLSKGTGKGWSVKGRTK